MTTHRQRALPKIIVWPRDSDDPELNIGVACISFQARRSVNDPLGKFSLSLLPTSGIQGKAALRGIPSLYAAIRPGDLISIGFDEIGGIMLGIVDRVARQHQMMGNKTTVVVTVTGSDFGKILTQDNIIHASLATDKTTSFIQKLEAAGLSPQSALIQVLQGVWGPSVVVGEKEIPGLFLNATVKDVAEFILNTSVTMTLPHKVFLSSTGVEGKPGDFIDASNITTWNDGRIWNEGLNNYQGNLWGFLTGVVDKDFYETYIQTIPNETSIPDVQLVIRPKPYDEAALEFDGSELTEETGNTWDDLKTAVDGLDNHEIPEDRTLSIDLGRSDTDVFSYFEVIARHDLIGNQKSKEMGLYYPVIDTYQLKRFGLRSYNTEIGLLGNALFTDPNANDPEGVRIPNQSEVSSEVLEFRRRLLNWYRISDYFESGSASVVGHDRYRPGDKFYFPWLDPAHGDEPGIYFYCSTVAWSWSFGDIYRCNLELIRGHNDGVIEAAKAEIAEDAPASNPSHIAEA